MRSFNSIRKGAPSRFPQLEKFQPPCFETTFFINSDTIALVKNGWGFLFILVLSTSAGAQAQTSFQRSPEPLVRLAEKHWNKAPVQNVEIGTLASTTQASYRIPLTVVMDSKSMWSWEKVIPYVRKSEAIFQQCDLQLSPITLVELEHPGLADFSPSTDYMIIKDFPRAEQHRPMAVFNSGTGGYVYANAEYYRSHAYPEVSKHTVFIDYLALALLDSDTVREYFKGVLVHELLHTLLNVGHNAIPGNILNNTPSRGHQISPEQCATLLQNPLVRKN